MGESSPGCHRPSLGVFTFPDDFHSLWGRFLTGITFLLEDVAIGITCRQNWAGDAARPVALACAAGSVPVSGNVCMRFCSTSCMGPTALTGPGLWLIAPCSRPPWVATRPALTPLTAGSWVANIISSPMSRGLGWPPRCKATCTRHPLRRQVCDPGRQRRRRSPRRRLDELSGGSVLRLGPAR